MLTAVLHDPGRLVHRVADQADRAGTSSRASAATPRARPCASPCAASSRCKAELEAFAACVRDDTPEPVSAYDGCRALIAALAVRDSAAHSPSRDPARHAQPGAARGRRLARKPHRDPLRHPCLQRGREHRQPDGRPRAAGARARRAHDLRRRRLDRRHRRRSSRPTARTCTWRSCATRSTAAWAPRSTPACAPRSASPPTTTRSSPSRPTTPPTSTTCRGCSSSFDAGRRRRARLGLRAGRARSSASPAGGWRPPRRCRTPSATLGGLKEIHTLSSLYRVYRAGTLRRAAETYGYLLVREPGFAANVELLLKLYNAGATVAEVPTVNDWSRRAGRLEDEPQADRARLRPADGRAHRRPHPAAAALAAAAGARGARRRASVRAALPSEVA